MNWIYPGGLPIAMSLTAYNAFLTGLIVLIKRKDKTGFFYFLNNFVIFLWGVGVSFQINNQLPYISTTAWAVFAQRAAIFIPSSWFTFVIFYTNTSKQYWNWILPIWGASLLLLFLSLGGNFVEGFQTIVNIDFYPIPGWVYKVFTLFFVVIVYFGFSILYRAIRRETSLDKKNDYSWIAGASLYGFGTGSLSFLPVYGIPWPQYNLLVMPAWQIFLTYAMTRYQAFDAEKMVQAAHRDKLAAIGTLATSINHEIRNPLYVIQGLADSYLANLEEGIYKNDEEKTRKSFEILKKTSAQATRAMEIMKSFAMFAKQNVNAQFKTETVDLNQLLDSILPLVNHELELEKIKLTREIPAGIYVTADKRHLEEIFFNLIVNAAQALKQSECSKGPEITIRGKAKDHLIEIEVKDNGPGIPSTQTLKVFEPFYTTKEEGTGLGLYVTRQLVEKNRGKIRVSSEMGKGTSFILCFPAVDSVKNKT